MTMRTHACLIFTVALASSSMAQTRPEPHQWKASLSVVDERAQPLAGAEIRISYYLPASPEKPTASDRITGFTDTNGVFRASHVDRSALLGFHVQKQEYYPTAFQYELGYAADDSPQWNLEQSLTLKRVLHPIAMYAKRVDAQPPVNGKAVGYDFTIGDWVSPHGKGVAPDVFFRRDYSKRALNDYDYKLTITFPKQGDGIQTFAVPQDEKGSGLRSPYEAPETGYEGEVTKVNISHPPETVEWDYDPDRNYFIRVRTVLDEHGNVRSALYGKIYGDFMHFSYYLNPTPNDRNIEFDPKRNLLGGLQGAEGVDRP